MEKDNFIKSLGLIIREARKKKGISIEELGFRSNITYGTISCLERGKANDLKVSNLYSLIKNLDIDPNLIFGKKQNLTQDKIALINKISSLEDGDLKIILE